MKNFDLAQFKGFIIKSSEQTPYTAILYAQATDGEKWWKVSSRWYRDSCEGRREFKEGQIAMITSDDRMIIETREMFDASLAPWDTTVNIEAENVTDKSVDVARLLLKDSIIPAGDVEEVVASLNHDTNYDMARDLSWVLVFLTRLIKDPQVHHTRVQQGLFDPSVLVTLDRQTLLPEVYRNPGVDTVKVDALIENKRRDVEASFYTQVASNEPTKRRDDDKRKPGVYTPVETRAHSNCPPGAKDVVYVQQDGKLYCFDRESIKDKTHNPKTDKAFPPDVLKELSLIKSPRYVQQAQNKTEVVREHVAQELAPGLFLKLKEEIELFKTHQCAACGAEVFLPRFKSIMNNKPIVFCSQECFEDFEFDK
jgi:hypothetical protein